MILRRPLRTPAPRDLLLTLLLPLAGAHCAPPPGPARAPATASPAATGADAAAASSGGDAAAAPAAQGVPDGDAPAAPGAPVAESEEPRFDFEAMLARERAPARTVAVSDPRGRWQASIEARRPPLVVDRGDHVSIRASLATKHEVRCEVHDGQLNPGAVITNLLAAAGNTILLEDALVYHVGNAGDSPTLFVRALYKTRQQPPLGGELKLAVSPSADYSFICIHDEPGYRESFARSVDGLVSSFRPNTPRRIPQYSAIWQFQVGEAKTGYSWERIYAEPDGTLSSFTFDVMLARLASGELRIRDDVAVEIHDRRGIVRGNFLSYRGNARAQELELTRSDQGGYSVRGNADGKPVEARLAPASPLASGYELLLTLMKQSAGARSWRRDEYQPRLDPLRVSSGEYSVDAARGTLTRKSAGKETGSWGLSGGLPATSRTTLGPNVLVGTLLSRQSTLGSEAGVTVGAQPEPAPSAALPLAERRKGFETHVFAETDRTPAKSPPAGVLTKVSYRAPLGDNVAYVTPPAASRRSAVIWIGGGLDWGIGESAWAKPARGSDRSARAFRDAGLVLMLPALRGSNENPGKNECFFGEVDDLIAAADYLATRADVDPERIYLAGHATGGTLALLAAASTDRFRAVFAFGPVGDVRQYGGPSGGGCLPENASSDEIALRAPLNFIGSIRTPTFVFEGGENGNADVFDELRERASKAVHFAIVPGLDPNAVVGPGTEVIARAIASGKVDDEHLVIGAKAGARR